MDLTKITRPTVFPHREGAAAAATVAATTTNTCLYAPKRTQGGKSELASRAPANDERGGPGRNRSEKRDNDRRRLVHLSILLE
jgi:hypothetical protein